MTRQKTFLLNNGYPKTLVNKQIMKVLNPVTPVSKEWLRTVVLPCKQGTSEAIQKVLNSVNVRLVSKRGTTLRSSLVKLKDPLPREKTRNCIYAKCAMLSYICRNDNEGTEHKNKEHERLINQAPQNSHQRELMAKRSAIAIHAIDTGHSIEFRQHRNLTQKSYKNIRAGNYRDGRNN